MNRPPVRLPKESKIASFKASTAITTSMFISLEARPEADMSDFFKYESSYGIGISGCKAVFFKVYFLLQCWYVFIANLH